MSRMEATRGPLILSAHFMHTENVSDCVTEIHDPVSVLSM